MSPNTMPSPAGVDDYITDDPTDLTRIPRECLPDLEQFQIEDGKPVDSVFNEKQMRLLTRPLYVSWSPPDGRTFQAFADVGLFYAVGQPGLSPDVMLSLDVKTGGDLSIRENRSYFVWMRGKPPDVVIEVVSDRSGGEAGYKKGEYARAGVPYYVLYDPQNLLKGGELRGWRLVGGEYQPLGGPIQFPKLGLGLSIWEGVYEAYPARWLRWTNAAGQLLPLEEEAIAEATLRADGEKKRADDEKKRADDEKKRADDEREKRGKLEARLRELGIEP
jgi:Uma2 family endonuclease